MAKLGEICAFQSGGTPSKNKPEYFGGEIPWISTTALNGGKINEADAVAWITPKAIRESAAKIVPANSIMIGTRVGIGKVAINTVEMSTSQDVISLINIDEDKWYKPYLCKLLLSKKDYFNSQARGATIKGIKIDVVANIDVPEIDYATQRKVAATLNKIDTLIVIRKQQLEKLDELVKARFVEMFGESEYPCNSLISLIIEGAGLSYGIVQPGDDGTGDMGVLRPVDFADGKIKTDSIKYIDRSLGDGFKKTELNGNELLITVRGTTGITALTDSRFKGMNVTRGIAVIRYDKKKVDSIYLNEYIKMEKSQQYIKEHTRGATLQQINLSELRDLEVVIPPLPLQRVFATFVERVDQQKQTVQQSLEKLELMKKALMQEYFG